MSEFEQNDIAIDTADKKNTTARRIILITLVVLVLIAVAAVIASKTGLDKALVRQQLDAIAAQMKERGAAQGRDIAFTYGDIDITGGLRSRHAVVHNPVLAMKPLEGEGYEPPQGEARKSLRIVSDSLEIYPEAANLSAMRLALPQPVVFTTIEEPEKKLLTISADRPIDVHYARSSENKVPVAHWQFTVPAALKLEYLREQVAAGTEDATPTVTPVYETLLVNLDKGEGQLSLQQDGSGLGEGTLDLQSIRIAPEAAPKEGLITVKQILSQWSNQRDEHNLNLVHSSFTIDTIAADPQLLPYAPISAAMDVTYEGTMPGAAAEPAANSTQQSAIKLKKFTITTKDATFSANADFTANAEDKLPVGAATVTVTNLPFIIGELKKFDLISGEREQLIAVLLQQVTGTPYADLKDVNIDVNRTRGGSFKIGKSTFEELFATLLQASLSKHKQPDAAPAPQIPAAPEKKAQPPIQLPEQTRG